MQCKYGHDHPPKGVTAATRNPTNQPRPYHCPDCPEANKPDKVPGHWKNYAIDDAQLAKYHPDACTLCFPFLLVGD